MTDTEPRRATNGDETDVFGRWRRFIQRHKHTRPGEHAAVKRRANRRERRERAMDAQRRVYEEAVPCHCDDRTCPECW